MIEMGNQEKGKTKRNHPKENHWLSKWNTNHAKAISVAWKVVAVLFVGIVACLVATKFATASTIRMEIAGDELNDGTWSVNSAPVIWKAMAYDIDSDTYLSLEDGGSIVWESSDSSVVSVSASSDGTESTVVLTPLSEGTVTIKATYSKVINTEEGSYEVSESATRKVVVKFEIPEAYIPTAPYEDDWILQSIVTNSNYPLTWTSSNENVVTIADDGSGNGIVTIVGSGATVITATTYDKQQIRFPMVINARFLENTNPVMIPYKDYYTISTNAVSVRDIVLKSDNENVVTIDEDGTAYGVSAGVTNLKAYAVDSSHEWYSKLPSPERMLRVKVALEVHADSTIVSVGDTLQLATNLNSEKVHAINWLSSNNSVATVDANGVITGHKKGNARITAMIADKDAFGTNDVQTATIDIVVVDSFSVSETEHIMNVGESFDLTGIVTNQKGTVSWMSSDDSVVKISASKTDSNTVTITGLKKGTATVTATQTIDGVKKTATCEVTVKEPVVDVAIHPSEVEVIKGQTYPLTAIFTPSMPDNMNVSWATSDASVVTVDANGIVTGVNGGFAVVSVVTEDGLKMASCNVSVREPVTSIQLDTHQKQVSLSQGTYQLNYTITPDGPGVNKDVTWESLNESVATVNENGLVTFKTPGHATILVRTVDMGVSGNLYDTCQFSIDNPVTSLELDYTEITLKLEEQHRITALVLPLDATNREVTWESNDTSVATVDESGLVHAVGSGNATILCKSVDAGYTAMCKVTVYQPVTEVVMSNSTMSVRKGTEFWLNATCLPANAMNKSVVWSSTNEDIATVDQNGKVTTLEPGHCEIIASSQDTGVSASCVLTVTQPITGIYLNVTNKTIMTNEQFVIMPTITPFDADNKNVTYMSSDENVCKVDENGVVTGVHGGKAVVIVKTEERGLIASCLVLVEEFVNLVDIAESDIKLNVGDTVVLSADVKPVTATNKNITWSSSNNRVATVDGAGKVTAVGMGETTIYAYAKDGSGLYDTCRISVIKGVSSVSITPSSINVSTGQTVNVSAVVLPTDATNKSLTWSSSDPTVALVDFNGNITGISAGICKIYAVSDDGNNVTGECRVTVKETVPATGVVINSKSITMLPGQTRTLTARIKPSRSEETVRWVSGDTSVATVDSNGVVTAKGQGFTEIYAITSESSVESSCEVIVLAMNATYITLGQYDYYELDVFGSTEKIKWYSNNPRVATVTSAGKVIARMPGKTTISAKVNGKVLYCTVVVGRIY